MPKITAITLPLPLRLGTVNCYLVETETGFFLIDTGPSNQRAELENALAREGCVPGDLDLIVLTHGDFDHTGNAAYLADKFGSRMAMHEDDSGMAERGDMFWNRTSGNAIIRWIAPILYGFPKSNRFRPYLFLEAGDDFSEYGLEARVVEIPGHSKGSIGILTRAGDLFCGDLLENTGRPALNSIMDDPTAGDASVEALKALEIDTVYPGHGKPFSMDLLVQDQEERG